MATMSQMWNRVCARLLYPQGQPLSKRAGEAMFYFLSRVLGHRVQLCLVVLTLGVLISACSEKNSPPESEPAKVMADPETETTLRPVILMPGRSLGPVNVGMAYGELIEKLGEPDREFGFRRTTNLTFFSHRLDVVVSTKTDLLLSDDSIVISVGTLPGAIVEGPLNIGQTETDATAEFGLPTVISGAIRYYSEVGVGLKLTEEGIALRVAVPRDRRANLVRLTPKGQRVFSEHASQHETWVNEILAGLDDDDIAGMVQRLDHLSGTLEEN